MITVEIPAVQFDFSIWQLLGGLIGMIVLLSIVIAVNDARS